MKKRLVSLLAVATMAAGMFAGCGAKEAAAPEAGAEKTADGEAAALPEDTGKVLNINVWNEEFKTRVEEQYPEYVKVDDTHGKIGDVDVVWNITPSDDNAYQNNLDETLLNQESAGADEKLDMFLVEADYALKYVDTDYVIPVADLGITDEDTANMYQYTKDIMTDSNGVLKGLSWQGCPGILFYNRDVAAEVLGTEEPDEVQEFVKDWATFKDTAAKMKDAGYRMTSSVNDSYRVYSNNVSTPWVQDGVLNVDDNLKAWVDDSMELVKAGETSTAELWSDDWKKGFFPEGKVFCYFGPAWLVNFSMSADQEGSVGFNGRWGGTVGPQSFYWGGTWICAAAGTDNANLVADIMKTLTTDTDTMVNIVKTYDDFVNNVPAMEEMAASDYTSKILGGQNPLPMYMEGAKSVDLSHNTGYDQGCTEEFQNAMRNYFEGNATYDEALELFYKGATEKYPDLKAPEK